MSGDNSARAISIDEEPPTCDKCDTPLTSIAVGPEPAQGFWEWNDKKRKYVYRDNPHNHLALFRCNQCGEELDRKGDDFLDKHKDEGETTPRTTTDSGQPQ